VINPVTWACCCSHLAENDALRCSVLVIVTECECSLREIKLAKSMLS